MRLCFVLFDGYTALDIVGGYEILARLPGIEVEFAAKRTGLIAADTRRLGMVAYRDFAAAARPDMIYVPGGPGVTAALQDAELLDFIRDSHPTSTWTLGVCNGVELLGASGALGGKTVTTNYFARERVAAYGAKVVPSRYCRDGKLVTGAGVSASIDACLFLVGEMLGDRAMQTLQLGIEYYPRPPSTTAATPDEASDVAKAGVLAFLNNGGREAMLGRFVPFGAYAPKDTAP